jgi:hypothetical protein
MCSQDQWAFIQEGKNMTQKIRSSGEQMCISQRKEGKNMTQKMRMLAMALLALVLAMAGIGGAVDAHAATTPASLAWAPTTSSGTYNYGTLAVKATKSVTFTLTNSGGKASGPLTITQSGSSAFSSTQDRCSGRSLGPNKSCTDTVEYAPTSSGGRGSAMLTASGKAASASLTLIGTTGFGSPGGTATLELSPAGNYIGSDPSGTGVYLYQGLAPGVLQTFTVTNTGTGSSDFLNLVFIGAHTYYTLYSSPNNNCGPPLAPGGSCTFVLEYTPPSCGQGALLTMTLNVEGEFVSSPPPTSI